MGINYVNDHIDEEPELLSIIERQEKISGFKARVQHAKLSKAEFEVRYGKEEIQTQAAESKEKIKSYDWGPEVSVKDQTFDESKYDEVTPQERANKREERRHVFEKAEKKLIN